MSKTKTAASPNDARKAIEPDQSLFKFSFFSLLGSVAALAVTAFLFFTLVINGSNKQLTATFFQSYAQTYTNYFNQKLAQLQHQLAHISTQTELAKVLQQQNLQAIADAEKVITANIPDLIKVKLLPYSGASLNREKYQLSFREVDMVNRAEQGDEVSAESHSYEGETVIRMVQAVKTLKKDTIAGVILATYHLNALQNQLNNFDTSNGAMRLEQVFRGSEPQTLIHLGASFNPNEPILDLKLDAPHLRVQFQPSTKLAQANSLSNLSFWLPLAFALIGVTLSILFSYLKLRTSVRSDAISLINYSRALINGEEEATPKFSLSLFHSMARTLANTEHDKALDNEIAKPVAAENFADSQAVPADAMEVDELLDTELEDEDILDLDLDTLVNPSTVRNDITLSEENTTDNQPAISPREISASIFRAYDIRGIVDETLDTDVAYRLGQAVGTVAKIKGNDSVVVGADGRLSSPELCAALVRGLRDSGSDVINIGTVPTPMVYFATNVTEAKSGIMITGSHNPSNYNGFKIVVDGNTLAGQEIQSLRQMIERNQFNSGNGALDDLDILGNYIEQITSDIAIGKPLKVVLDCGNGVAGVVAPKLIEALGCEVIPLYCEIDGRFPNHHPDPGKPENLKDLIDTVLAQQADIGLAFDGDGDRLGVVTNRGNIIWPDRLMMLFAKDVASRNPGADIIFDVKCSRRLAGLISNYGGRPIMWKTGHSLIKAKMRETGALLAGEMSGHIFFKERWFGFDDGIYSAARLLEILGLDERDADTLFEAFPDDISTPEINIKVTDESKFDIVSQLQQEANFADAEVITIDGIRADFDNGWGLVRASNTTPVLVLRFGADDEAALAQIQSRFKQALLAVAPDLKIPF